PGDNDSRSPVPRFYGHLQAGQSIKPRLPCTMEIRAVSLDGVSDDGIFSRRGSRAEQVAFHPCKLLEGVHAVGAESARISISHLYTGPAIGVVAGGDHRTGANRPVVLCEIYNGSHAQSHIEHIETRSDQTER